MGWQHVSSTAQYHNHALNPRLECDAIQTNIFKHTLLSDYEQDVSPRLTNAATRSLSQTEWDREDKAIPVP